MGTQTILKNDGIFVIDDYKNKRAAQRLTELATDEVHAIRRNVEGDIEAYLVSPSKYAEKSLVANVETVDDDSLAVNIDKHMDLILGRSQVKARLDLIEAQNLEEDFKVYEYINTKQYADERNLEVVNYKGGVARGYLMSKEAYDLFESVTVGTPSYTGTGDGTLDTFTYKIAQDAQAETITITATSATEFDVVGSVSGAIGTATVGTLFESDLVNILITAGGTPFVAADEFTVAITLA